MRLFVSIQMNEAMKDLIEKVQDYFRLRGIRGNYTVRENLHMTLVFIGEYQDADEIMEILEGIAFTPFTITMEKIGHFDEIWWTGVKECAELERLVRNLRHALADAGIPYDRKTFKAHVTYLRKPTMIMKDDFTQPDINIEPTEMTVQTISLMRSTRGKNRMIYDEIGSVEAQEE